MKKSKLFYLLPMLGVSIAILLYNVNPDKWLQLFGGILACVFACFCGVTQGNSDIERMKFWEREVEEKGVDWAVKELVVNPNMNDVKSHALRKAISQENDKRKLAELYDIK